MMGRRWMVWIWLLGVLVLAGCGGTSPSEDVVARLASMPGVHLSLAQEVPSGFHGASLDDVFANRHFRDEDIWLHAPEADLERWDPSGEFRAWLQLTRPVVFSTQVGEVYWIPRDMEADRLAFLLEHDLTRWVESGQLAELWWQRGESMRAGHRYQEAIEVYERALALDPNLVKAHVGLAAALMGLGRNEEALQHLLFAVERQPDDYWAQRLLGNAYLNLYRYALAVGPLTRAYLIRPEVADPLIGVALGLGRSGQEDLALRVLDKAEAAISEPRQLDAIRALREEFSAAGD